MSGSDTPTTRKIKMSGPTLPISQETHAEKYRTPHEGYREAINRIANALKDNEEHYHQIRDVMGDMRFWAGGRVQSAMGSTKNVTPYNCFVSGTIEDSFVDGGGSIMARATEAASTMRQGGGIGYDFSTLRPRGALIKKLESMSSGPLEFMKIYDAICKCVASSGHRRGAQMGVLRVDHPDIEEFIHAKQDQNTLSGFNISVAITDQFMECLATGKPFPLKFAGQVYREVDAQALWDMIMRSTWDWAEPGVLFIDTINRMNNLWYCETIAATNPCVPGSTPILTSTGYRRIDECLDATVLVWNGVEWSEVQPRVTGHDQPMVVVQLSDGSELECTTAHKFVLEDDTRVEASALQEGDVLQTCDWPVIAGTEALPLAYQQGFFVGDGWQDKRGRCYIGLYGEKQKLRHLFEPHAQSVHQYEVGGGWGDKYEHKLYAYMGKHAMRSKQYVPGGEVMLADRLAWLAGLADSDGCATKDGSIQISAKSRDLLYRVKLLLNTMGTTGSLQPMKDCWRLSISGSRVAQLRDLGLTTHRLDISYTPQRNASRKLRVVSVTPTERCDTVYCFTEPLKHTGVFYGMYTAQCGEQPLPPHGACLLGSFNLTRYLVSMSSLGERRWDFDWDMLKHDIPIVVRAMDNVVDRAKYPLYEQEKEAKAKRRMGLGVMGHANTGEALGLPYGTPEFIKFTDQVLGFINRECYLASIQLSKEKGHFQLFDAEKYGKSQFIQGLDDEVQSGIQKHGIRNSHLTSIAPTGTISLCADNVSSGIEPVFSHSFMRTIQTFTGPKVEEVTDYGSRVLGIKGRTADEVGAQEHVSVLAAAARNVDSAVSKTCNVGSGVTWDEFKNIYVSAYEQGAKGCTTFRKDGKRMGVLVPKNEADEPEAACYIDPLTGRRECQ